MGWVAYKKRCRHLEKQNQSLLKQIQGHKEQIDQLQEQNQQLKAKLARSQKTSRNSSKPPSSDIVKPKPRGRKRRKNKRKIGAQPGHPKHQRPPFDEGQIRSTFEYHLKKCPCCQGPVQRDWQAAPRIQQQIELPDQLFYIDQYSAYGYGCAHCRKTYFAKIPRDILQGGLCGPRLTSMVALMKGALSLSYSSIQSYLEQVLELPLSRDTWPSSFKRPPVHCKFLTRACWSPYPASPGSTWMKPGTKTMACPGGHGCFEAVSYTHLTLPTILLV